MADCRWLRGLVSICLLRKGKYTDSSTRTSFVMNSFVMSHDLMRGQIGSYENEKLLISSFMMTEV